MKKIEMVETNDGKLFSCQEDAELHVVGKICEVLDDSLTGVEKKYPWFTRSHVLEIIQYMAGDYKKTDGLITQLNNTFE